MAATVSALDKINTYLVGEGSSATTEQLQEKTREIFEGYRGDLEENVKAVIENLAEGNPLHDRIEEMGIDSTKFSSFVDGISLVSDKVVSVATSQLLMGEIKEFGREDSRELFGIPEEIQPIVQTFFKTGTIPEGLPDKEWIALAKAALGLDIPTLIDTLVEQRIDSFPKEHAGVVSLYEMILDLGDASLPMGDYNAFQGLRIKCEGALVANWIGGKEAEAKEELVTEIQTFKCPSDTPIKTVVEWLGKCSNAHDASLVRNSKMYNIRTICEHHLVSHWANLGGNVPLEHKQFLPHIRVVDTFACKTKEIVQKIILQCPYAETSGRISHRPTNRDEAIILYRQLITQCDDESKTHSKSCIFELRGQCEEMIIEGWDHGIPESEEVFLKSISYLVPTGLDFDKTLALLDKCPNVSTLFCERLTQSQLEQLHEKTPQLKTLIVVNSSFEVIPSAMAKKLTQLYLYKCPKISNVTCPQAIFVQVTMCSGLKKAAFSKATDIVVRNCPQLESLACEKARRVQCDSCESLPKLFLPNALMALDSANTSMTQLICPRAIHINCQYSQITSLIAPHAEKIECKASKKLKRVVCSSTTEIAANWSSSITRTEA